MKVIISHDVDHITVSEHITRDLIIPKFWIRTLLELIAGYISGKEFIARIREMLENKWNYIDELMEFDKAHGIPSTYFIGVANGRGLSYSLKNAAYWIKRIKSNGFDIGVHGICYTDPAGIKSEYEKFVSIVGNRDFGIRMHYLKLNDDTLNYLVDAGYLFDSSLYGLRNPFKVKNMWEFPLHIMDSYMFESRGRLHLLNTSFEEAKERTRNLLNRAVKAKIRYFTILLHDRVFGKSFGKIKKWYEWLVEYLKEEKFEFVSYREAIGELEAFRQ